MYTCLGTTLNPDHYAFHYSSTEHLLLGHLRVPRSPTNCLCTNNHFQMSLFKKGLLGSLMLWVLKAKKEKNIC